MSVNDLNSDELQELKEAYIDQQNDFGEEEDMNDVPMSNVIAHYEGVYFVKEDFFCNL